MENHEFGAHVERLFDDQCRAKNIQCEPTALRCIWDREVASNGKLIKVQIKGTRTLAKHRGGRGKIKLVYSVPGIRQNTAQSSYAESGVDFMAIYVEPKNQWFIIPASLVMANRIRIARTPAGRMKAAIERWDYFKN